MEEEGGIRMIDAEMNIFCTLEKKKTKINVSFDVASEPALQGCLITS